ncbi:MAG TPA: LPS export ABC transporter permease LptF [Steroidobacteraceae bacterium]|nr:LPS export ABC transporter permease LptF [Steroidobacteraceae bacterium]
MSRIIDRYLLREATQSWLSVTGVLLVILVSNQLSRTLQRAAEQGLPQDIVMSLIGLSTIENLTVLMPVGLLLAIVLAFGRLYHESEMAAVQACGIGTLRLYRPVSVLAAFAAVALAWLAFFGGPDAAQKGYAMRSHALRDAQIGSLAPGKFRSFGTDAVFYAQRSDNKGVMYDVFLERNQAGKVEVAVAERAEHTVSADGSTHTVTLFNGTRYDGTPGQPQFRITDFESHGIPVLLPELVAPKDRRELMATRDLIGSTDRRDQAQLSWRLSAPIMAFVLAFVAVPLSRLQPRQGRYARMAQAILVYFVYFTLLSTGKVWIERGKMPATIGLWWVHMLMIGYALVLLTRDRTIRWRATPARIAAT